jgi:hypothetical protein
MQADNSRAMLAPEDLRDIDRLLLEYLEEGRITPVYARERVIDEGHRDSITSTYCGQRLQRLEEHSHVRNLYETGLYELVEDPRESGAGE